MITDEIVYLLCIETVKILETQQEKLHSIKWTDGESNLDSEYSKLSCECCEKAWIIIQQKYKDLSNINIKCNIPDINIIFIYENGNQIYKKIELKSSKYIKIPGSTINKLDINQSLIYCLRPENKIGKYKIKCSQYHSAIEQSNIDLFQDRTPRPHLNFQKMKDVTNIVPYQHKDKSYWLEHYSKCAINRINENTSCNYSWQDDLVKIMKKYIIEDYLKNTSIEQIQIDKITLEFKETNI